MSSQTAATDPVTVLLGPLPALLKADNIWDMIVLTTKNNKRMKIKRSSWIG